MQLDKPAPSQAHSEAVQVKVPLPSVQMLATQNSDTSQDQARSLVQQQPHQPHCLKKPAAADGDEEPSLEQADASRQASSSQSRLAKEEENPLTEEENQVRQEHWANQKQHHEIEKQEAVGGCRLVKVGHARSLSTMQPLVARGSVKRMLDADSAVVSRSKTRGAARPVKRKGRGKQTVVLVAHAGLRRSVAPQQQTPPCHEALWDSFVTFGRSCDLKFDNVDVLYQQGADFLAKGHLDLFMNEGRKVDTVKLTDDLAAALRRFVPEVLWAALLKHANQEAASRTFSMAECPRSLSPAHAQAPLPWEACCLLIEHLCFDGNREMGLAVAMAHALRLRSWRLLDCTIGQLTPPLQSDPRDRQSWCLVLHPGEQTRRTTIGMGDGSMLIEGFFSLLLTPVIHSWIEGRNSNEMLFSFTFEKWSQAFEAAGEACGLGGLGPVTLQQLRHGWAKSSTEHGFQQLWQLEPKIRRRCMAAARNIGETFGGASSSTSMPSTRSQ